MKNKNKKGLIWGIVSGVALVLVVVALATLGNKKTKTGLDGSYFVSDNTKYVAVINENEMRIFDNVVPNRGWIVYYYADGMVTEIKYYYEFDDAETAQAILDGHGQEADLTAEDNYVVWTAESYTYYGMTAADAAAQIEETTTQNAE